MGSGTKDGITEYIHLECLPAASAAVQPTKGAALPVAHAPTVAAEVL